MTKGNSFQFRVEETQVFVLLLLEDFFHLKKSIQYGNILSHVAGRSVLGRGLHRPDL